MSSFSFFKSFLNDCAIFLNCFTNSWGLERGRGVPCNVPVRANRYTTNCAARLIGFDSANLLINRSLFIRYINRARKKRILTGAFA